MEKIEKIIKWNLTKTVLREHVLSFRNNLRKKIDPFHLLIAAIQILQFETDSTFYLDFIVVAWEKNIKEKFKNLFIFISKVF